MIRWTESSFVVTGARASNRASSMRGVRHTITLGRIETYFVM
jgi:hypothetical protein